jgi:decaprenylphospho-beta-D-erythro-pentofuranosid-2-ulose 2-reductase
VPLSPIRSVLVLGGASDIGLATVEALVDRGARRIILATRRPSTLDGPAARFRAAGAQVAAVEFDAADVGAHPALLEEVFRAHAPVDLVLCSFGVLGPVGGAQLSRDEALRTMQVNLLGTVSAILGALPHLQAQDHGRLVVFSSVAGQRPRPRNFVYGASKAGIDSFCQGLDMALAGSAIDVLIVRPGFVRTKMTAGMKRPPLSCSAEQVADAVVGGLTRGAHTVWVPRSMGLVAAILRLLPSAVLRRLPF